MKQEHDDFAQRHPSLDQALRDQLKGPVMDAAFRKQVMARIAAQRAELARASSAPVAARSRLRAQLVLQVANIVALALAAALLFQVAWPRLAAVPAVSGLFRDWGLVLAMTLGGAVLLFGLRRVSLPGWVRSLGME